MNDSVYHELVRLSLKREITTDDRLRIEAALAAHPELRERWDEEAAVSNALRSLPNAPISSNFTALVLETIDLEEREGARKSRRPGMSWLRWFQPRAVGALGVVVLIGFGVFRYKAEHERVELARNIGQVSREFASLPSSLPSPEIFNDFEAIEQLRQVSVASDDELLTVLLP